MRKIPLIAVIIMTILSFTNLFGVEIAGLSVVLGIAAFFINKVVEKQAAKDSGLDIKTILTVLKDKKLWIWIALPLIMDIVAMAIAKLFLPEYIDHVLGRAEAFVSFDKNKELVFQLAVLALGEEIAWRAFFQRQLNKVLPIIPTILLSSILFALGHYSAGNAIIVIYDIFFVFINSILYGIVFHKSKNAWISWISHFAANLFSVIILAML